MFLLLTCIKLCNFNSRGTTLVIYMYDGWRNNKWWRYIIHL